MSNLSNFIVQRLLTYDPTLDVSQGSPLKSLVVDPIAELISDDPLDTDARQLITSKLQEAFPDLTLGAGDAFVDIMINAASLFVEPYRAELSRIANSQSLLDTSSLSEEDIDALASNWAITRIAGTQSRVTVHVSTLLLSTLSINAGIRFLTSDGVAFRPVSRYTLSPVELRAFASGEEYIIPIECVAEQRGALGNVGTGAIVVSQNMPNVVSVTNRVPGVGGVDEESSDLFVSRLSNVINERSLVSDRGIRAKILSDRSDIERVSVVGFGDPEMERDTVSADTNGASKGAGFLVSYTSFSILSVYSGDVSTLDTLHLTNISNGDTEDVIVTSVELGPIAGGLVASGIAYVVRGSFSAAHGSVHAVHVEGAAQAEFGQETITNDVHLGGKTDVYITPSSDEQSSITISDIQLKSDVEGYKVLEYGSTGIKSCLRLFSIDRAGVETDVTLQAAEFNYLVISSGLLEGSYRIISTRIRGGLSYVLVSRLSDLNDNEQLEHNNLWVACDRLEIPLSDDDISILPRHDESLSCTVIPNRVKVQLDRNDVHRYVRIGDLIFISDLDFESEIVAVFDAEVELASAPTATGIFTCTITRPVPRAVLPLIEPVSLTSFDQNIPYGYSLGAKVTKSSSPLIISDGEKGRVLPHYNQLFKADDRRFSVDISDASYSVFNFNGRVAEHDLFTTSLFRGRQGSAALLVTWNDSDLDFEFELPNDFFMPGPYTILSCYGDLDVTGLLNIIKEKRDILTNTNVTSSIETLVPFVPTRMEQPSLAEPGDIITLGGVNHIVDRVYPIEIPTNLTTLENNDTERVVSRENVIKITLIRLKVGSSAPTLSAVEDQFAFTIPRIAGSVSIDLYDFISMLCAPSNLLPANVADQIGINANAAINGAGLPPGVNVSYSVSDYDEKIVSVTRPSKGAMDLYYLGERTIDVYPIHYPLFSHERANEAINVGVLDISIPPRTDAEGLYIDPSYIEARTPSNWSRLSQARFIDVDVGDDLFVRGPLAVNSLDQLDVSDLGAALDLINVEQGDELWTLPESFTTESFPPTVETWSLYLVADNAGSSPQDWLANNAFKDALSIDAGQTLMGGTADFTSIINAYGVDIRSFLTSLDPADRLSIDFTATPNASFTFYLCVPTDEYFGLPIFSTQAGNSVFVPERCYESQVIDIPVGIESDYLWLDSSSMQSDTALQVLDVNTTSIDVNSTSRMSTSAISSRGWVYSKPSDNELETNKVVLSCGFVDYIDEAQVAQRATSRIADNACGVITGGTTRLFDDTDVGKTLSFVNNVWVPSANPLFAPNSFPDNPYIQRGHLGVYTITDVESLTHIDSDTGNLRTYEQVVTLDRDIDFTSISFAYDMALAEGTVIPLFFHLSRDAIPASDNDLKTCVAGQVYSRDIAKYRIAALAADYSTDNVQSIYLSTLDDIRPSSIDFGIFRETVVLGLPFNGTGITNVPYYIHKPYKQSVSTTSYVGGIHRVSLPFISSELEEVLVGSTRSVVNAGEENGYYYSERGEAYSSKESVFLSLPPITQGVDVYLNELSHVYLSNLAVRSLTSQYQSHRHRVVCSDVLIRRSLPCHLGVYLRYNGGSQASVVQDDIRRVVSLEIDSNSDISVSDLIALAHKRGARRVVPGTLIYYVLSDLGRRLHISFIEDTFDNSLIGTYEGTRRITGVKVQNSTRLGVTLDVDRN